WTRNFRNGAAAEVLHDGKKTAMRGELIEDPAVFAELAHDAAGAYGVKRAQRMMGMGFRDQRIPTLDEFKETAEREHLVAVKLTPTPQAQCPKPTCSVDRWNPAAPIRSPASTATAAARPGSLTSGCTPSAPSSPPSSSSISVQL